MAKAQLPFGNIPSRKSLNILKVFQGTVYIFYFTMQLIDQGTPVKVKASSGYDVEGPTSPVEVEKCVRGSSDGPKCIGLTMQDSYDDNLSGQMSQLKDYHFVNDTAQRINGQPIGILGGTGHVALKNWYGSNLAAQTQAFVGLSGKITNTGADGDKLPMIFETTAAEGEYVRLRFNFPLTAGL